MMERAARCRDEQGAVELFVLVVVLALIVALGIVVDLGEDVYRRPAWTAQQAACVAAFQVSGQTQGGSVTCTSPLISLPIPNPGDRTITRTGTSVVDPYRSRT